jgi:hypothetical protein
MGYTPTCKDCEKGQCSVCRGKGRVWGMFGNCTRCSGQGGKPCARHR